MLQTAASLAALGILTATTAPVIERYMNHAKVLKSKGEIKVLASVLQLLVNDLGENGVRRSPDARDYLSLMVGAGDVPTVEHAEDHEWNEMETVGQFNDYLVTNRPGFSPKAGGSLTFGWDGPYLQTPLGTDPWGNRYAASIGLLSERGNLVPVIVNAGPDGVLSIPFRLRYDQMEQDFGDDIYCILR
ncbi:MAG: hypothetical protein HN742_40035 [Lentisphaerae bacterium]|nr:hypothetical protein [Lentisphaerota bacterium]MBT4815742.1 hypothetical protein [Lentisphaerota bacterium]MBT5613151.1 hypothetical protein [Lentisphaerota bacterium]MBT7061935.1 hypothetical protein [Lentisphaerota bacterium]MBT7848126.1 hypothetical protein [Lentisphaerota bacterium]